MSAKSFLVAGDQVIFSPISPKSPVMLMAPAMTVVISKSINTASFRGITTEGDEKLWIFPACPYTVPTSGHIIPGVVMCKIKKLHPSNIAKKIKENDKSVLLVGDGIELGEFEAEFTIISPATQPPPSGAPDSAPGTPYSGTGYFLQSLDSKAENQG